MNWNERNFFCNDYFDDIITALKQHEFLQPGHSLTPVEQVASWIVDRVDHVLAPSAVAAVSPTLAEKAMTAFEICSELFPEETTAHFRDQAGIRSFDGLFHTANIELYAMWCRIAKRTHSSWHTQDSWLHKLACALTRDSDLGGKMAEAAECCKLGMSRKETLDQIEDHHRQRGSYNPSAKSLLLLELL